MAESHWVIPWEGCQPELAEALHAALLFSFLQLTEFSRVLGLLSSLLLSPEVDT